MKIRTTLLIKNIFNQSKIKKLSINRKITEQPQGKEKEELLKKDIARLKDLYQDQNYQKIIYQKIKVFC